MGKPWGYKGEVTVHLEDHELEEFEPTGALFVDMEGQKVPFFYTSLRDRGRAGILVKFDELTDPQSAAIVVGRDLFAPPGHLSEASKTGWDPMEFIGMVVRDETHGELGEVTGIEGSDRNPVMSIMLGGQEVMVPIVEELILEVNMEENSILVRTPPGLIDLYRTPGGEEDDHE